MLSIIYIYIIRVTLALINDPNVIRNTEGSQCTKSSAGFERQLRSTFSSVAKVSDCYESTSSKLRNDRLLRNTL